MPEIHRHLTLLALPCLLASVAVLALAAVHGRLWVVQFSSVCMAGVFTLVGAHFARRNGFAVPNLFIFLIALFALASTLLASSEVPARWLPLGPVNLYIAPVVLPAFLVACAISIARSGRPAAVALIATISAMALLAFQPDASQVLAVFVALVVMMISYKTKSFSSIITLATAALICAFAFTRPDPLQPIPHVEGVFVLAFEHSMASGLFVASCALTFLIGLYRIAAAQQSWLMPVAAYYAILFGCSIAGLTPAPLIGYGAGPWLGFGLMLAMAHVGGTQLIAAQTSTLDRTVR